MSVRLGFRQHDCTRQSRVIDFGDGKLIIGRGKVGGRPSVHIEPAPKPGEVGRNVPESMAPARDYLVPHEVVLTFPTEEQAELVATALTTPKEPTP